MTVSTALQAVAGSSPEPADSRLDCATWSVAIQQFCQATGLTASLFDASGQRVAGPFHCTPLSQLLSAEGFFEPGGAGHAEERALVTRTLRTGASSSQRFASSLRLDALPLLLGEACVGVIVFGWVFDHFSDPLECERLARVVGLSGHKLWSVVRQQRPTSAASFDVSANLLTTLVTFNLQQVAAIEELRSLARVRNTFLITVSHELRTPLQSLRLRLEQLLRSRLDDPENVRRLLQAMKRSVDAEAKLVEDLLDASRTMSGKLTMELAPVNLAVMVAEAVESSEPAAIAKGITLRTSVPPVLASELVGDSARLRQVLFNLLVNALKFTPDGGRVQVAVRELPRELEISVTDSGVGIAADQLRKIFEPFSQGEAAPEERRKGLGLGLSIARHIVELHGGSLSAQSEGKDRGATFVVRLPTAPRR